MKSLFLKFLPICSLISSTLVALSSALFVFEVKLHHYQNVERILFDGTSRCGATIDVPCQVSMEFCLMKKPRTIADKKREDSWAANLPDSSLATLPCLIRKKTGSPLDELLGSSNREGADRNLFFFDGSILNARPKLENPLKFDIDDQKITNKDLQLVVYVYHDVVNVMDIFTWDAPSTGIPLQQALDGDPRGWTDDSLRNLQPQVENKQPSKFVVKLRNLCARNYYDAANGCNVLCAPKHDSNYGCDTLTGEKVCRDGYTNREADCSELINKCDSSPCSNGATCVRDGADSRGFSCQCPTGFKGPNCEVDINECTETKEGKPDDSTKCLNGGTCVDRVDDFDCECAPGFLGPRCNSSGPCFNYCSRRGTCVLVNQAATICNSNNCNCSCDIGFQGVRCEDNVNECKWEPNPCDSEHATCVDTIGSYVCNCEEGWTGKKCDDDLDECRFQTCIKKNCTEEIDVVDEKLREESIATCIVNNIEDCWHPDPRIRLPCNGGECINKIKGVAMQAGTAATYNENQEISDKGFFCVCPAGYTGANCSEVTYDECERRSPSPCVNGGSCVNLPGDFICECPDGFYGQTCKNERTKTGGTDAGEPYGGVPVFTLIIILATIYTLAFVMAMAWVIWLWMRRENSKTDIFFAIPNPTVSRSNSYKQVGVY